MNDIVEVEPNPLKARRKVESNCNERPNLHPDVWLWLWLWRWGRVVVVGLVLVLVLVPLVASVVLVLVLASGQHG